VDGETVPDGQGYVLRGGRAGADRLHLLARSLQPETSALLDRVAIPAGARCLDLGCGPGDVSLELARRVGARGRVAAVDMDAAAVEIVRERAAREGLANIDCVVAAIDDLPDLSPQDLVYSRNVLQHLADPVEALRMMWARVGSGGSLVAEDADFDGTFCWPPEAAFAFWVERYSQVLRSHGGDPMSGRKLAAHFVAAGSPQPEIRVTQRAYLVGDYKQLPYLTLEAAADTMVAEGVAGRDEISAAATKLRALSSDPTVLFGMPRNVQAWARRG
jgi:ubiquinone/menaquinone biosynthesis C-methylase UbiE